MSKCQMHISTSPQNSQNVCYDSSEHDSKLYVIKASLKHPTIGISVAHMRSVLLVGFE